MKRFLTIIAAQTVCIAAVLQSCTPLGSGTASGNVDPALLPGTWIYAGYYEGVYAGSLDNITGPVEWWYDAIDVSNVTGGQWLDTATDPSQYVEFNADGGCWYNEYGDYVNANEFTYTFSPDNRGIGLDYPDAGDGFEDVYMIEKLTEQELILVFPESDESGETIYICKERFIRKSGQTGN